MVAGDSCEGEVLAESETDTRDIRGMLITGRDTSFGDGGFRMRMRNMPPGELTFTFCVLSDLRSGFRARETVTLTVEDGDS